jgi:hypothetical protein
MSEFSFFETIDLLEVSIPKSDLFVKVVHFLSLFITESQIPEPIPIPRLKDLMLKVIENLQQMIGLTVEDNESRILSITHLNVVIELISSYLKLIKRLCEKQMESESIDFYLFDDQERYDSNESSCLNNSQTPESIDCRNNNLITELLSLFLRSYKEIFKIFLERFSENSNQSFQMISSMNSCLLIILENDIYAKENLFPFLQQLLTDGNIAFLMQIIRNSKIDPIEKDFRNNLSNLLSNFLIKMQEFDVEDYIINESLFLSVEDLKEGMDLIIGNYL